MRFKGGQLSSGLKNRPVIDIFIELGSMAKQLEYN